jgi:hypothetical protein
MRGIVMTLVLMSFAFPTYPDPPKLTPSDSPNISASGNEFLEGCRYADERITESNMQYASRTLNCLGWAEGFLEGIYVTDEFHGSEKAKYMVCPESQATVAQVIRIVRKYIEANPQKAHMTTRYLASEALIRAFPCTSS